MHHPRLAHFFFSIPPGAVFPFLDGSSVLFRFADICVEILDAIPVWPFLDTRHYNNVCLANNGGKRKNSSHTIDT